VDVTSVIFNMVVQAVLIVVVFFVLYKFAWKPFLHYLHERQNAVMALHDEARVEKEFAAKLSLEAQAKLQEVNQKSDEIIESAELTAKQIVLQERENVGREVARKLELADREAEQQRHRLEEEMQQNTINLAAELAAQFLTEKSNEEETEQQITRFLKKMGE